MRREAVSEHPFTLVISGELEALVLRENASKVREDERELVSALM